MIQPVRGDAANSWATGADGRGKKLQRQKKASTGLRKASTHDEKASTGMGESFNSVKNASTGVGKSFHRREKKLQPATTSDNEVWPAATAHDLFLLQPGNGEHGRRRRRTIFFCCNGQPGKLPPALGFLLQPLEGSWNCGFPGARMATGDEDGRRGQRPATRTDGEGGDRRRGRPPESVCGR